MKDIEANMICGCRPSKFLVMAIIGLAVMLWQPVYAAPDLILDMRFDDDPSDGVLDSSPYGNHGSCPGGIPTLTTDKNGNPNSAYDFNGVDDYVNCGSDTSIDNIWDGGGTFAAWVYPESIPTDPRIFNKGGMNNALVIETGAGIIGFRTNSYPGPQTTTGINAQEWTHLAVTYNNSGLIDDVKIYFNGVAQPLDTTAPGIVNDASSNLIIGSDRGTRRYFHGKIDDVRIYNGALSESEVLALYNGNIPPDISLIPDILTKSEGDTVTPAEIELATDLDGDPLTYTYSGWRTSLPYTTTFEDKGTHILHVDVSDGTDTAGKDITIIVYRADGLTGYWKFDETSGTTAEDSSGMGNTGTLINGATWTEGRFGGALSLDGMDSYVDCGADASLNLVGSLTLSAWVKPESLGDGGLCSRIIVKGQDATSLGAGFTFALDNRFSTNPYCLGYAIHNGYYQRSQPDAFVLGGWQHVALVWDEAAGNITFYANGVDKGTYKYDEPISGYPTGNPEDSAGYPLVIGIKWQDLSGDFNGLIDEVRVYNRALSAAEIQALHNAHTITATASSGGSITPGGAVTVNHGSNQTFTITADTGYHIADVLVDKVSVGAVTSYTFSNVTTNHIIEASFAINTYPLTITAVNGSVKKTPDKVVYRHGEEVILEAIADTGYKFIDWSGALTGNQNPVTIIVDSDKSIIAKFAIIGSQFGDVSKVIPYPNPFRVNEAKNNTLKFINLPDEVVLQIFNIFGEMIYKEEYTATGGRIDWDGNNNYGRPVATGLYIYLVTDRQGHKKTGRISLIR